jgi:hypothetical protein
VLQCEDFELDQVHYGGWKREERVPMQRQYGEILRVRMGKELIRND